MTSTLAQKAPGETEVTTTSRVNITGILAQMGRGMVQDVSDQMFQIFSQRVRAEPESAAPAAAPVAATAAAPAVPTPPAAPSKPEALDVGALGARALVRRPVFWVAVAAAAVLVYLLLR